MKGPTFIGSYRKQDSDCINFGYWGEGLCLTENTHRHPTGFFPGGRVHFSHVLFFLSASISVSIAFFHSSELNASCVVDGICSEHKAAVIALASLDKFPVAMFATGYLDLEVTFSGEYLLGGIPLFSLGGREYLPVVSPALGSTCSVTGSTSSTTGSTCSTSGSTWSNTWFNLFCRFGCCWFCMFPCCLKITRHSRLRVLIISYLRYHVGWTIFSGTVLLRLYGCV
ncbi:hypothetical protein Hanom_Chr03g00203141 [Helianthus anomalus]